MINKQSSTITTNKQPLANTIICLTSLPPSIKTTLHSQIISLGGTYVRDLDTTIVTHLLSPPPNSKKDSPKLNQAIKKRKSGASTIEILNVEWLHECFKRKKRVREGRFRLLEEERVHDDDVPLEEKVDDLLEDFELGRNGRMRGRRNRRRSFVFSACHFYFLVKGDGGGGGRREEEEEEGKRVLSKVVRKGRGIVHWDMNGGITHIVVQDSCDDGLRKKAISFCKHHPNCPQAISPQWILDSFQQQTLLPFYEYIPNPKPATCNNSETNRFQQAKAFSSSAAVPPPQPQDRTCLSRTNSVQSTSSSIVTSSRLHPPIQNTISSSHDIFHKSIFVVLRQTTPQPNKTIDVNVSDLERTIKLYGGHLLTRKIMLALQNNAATANHSASALPPSENERVCYVISSGGHGGSQIIDAISKRDIPIHPSHPLLAELMALSKNRNNNPRIQIVFATPTWINCCIQRKGEIPPQEYPFLFQPQNFYMHCFPREGIVMKRQRRRKVRQQKKEDTFQKVQLKIALTGFAGVERIGLIHLVQAMGAVYTENLTCENTHLICPDSSGAFTANASGKKAGSSNKKSAKFEKACDWGLFVVSIDWLYHVMQYGYYGKDEGRGDCSEQGTKEMRGGDGCEHLFSLVPSQPKKDDYGMNDNDTEARKKKKNAGSHEDNTSIQSDKLDNANKDRTDDDGVDMITRQNLSQPGRKGDCSSFVATPITTTHTNASTDVTSISDPIRKEVPRTTEDRKEKDQEDKNRLRSALRILEAPIERTMQSPDEKSLFASLSSRKRRDRSPQSSLSLFRQKKMRRLRQRATMNTKKTTGAAVTINKMDGFDRESDGVPSRENHGVNNNDTSASEAIPPSASQLPDKSQVVEEESIEYTCSSSFPMPSPSSSFPNRQERVRYYPLHVTQQDKNANDNDNDGNVDESQILWYPERTQQQH